MKSIMAVCDVYKLLRMGQSYVKDGMIPERTNIILKREYAELKNEKWKKTGLWYEIDEEATKDFYDLAEKKRLERKEKEKTERKLNDLMTDVIKKGVSPDEEVDDTNLKSLRDEYKLLYGKNSFHGWDEDKLKAKINEKKEK